MNSVAGANPPSDNGTGDFAVSGEGSYEYKDHVLFIYSGSLTVSGATDTDRIVIDGNAAVTLNSVSIAAANAPAVALTGGSSVSLRLSGSSYLSGGGNYAALEVGASPNGSLASVILGGKGSLTAVGGEGSAGIGGSMGRSSALCGNIRINSGEVTALGGDGAAGIGSGYHQISNAGSRIPAAVCGSIVIDGGIVTAEGGESAAGIGGGIGADKVLVTISGGEVTAVGGASERGLKQGGAGIGSAYYGGYDPKSELYYVSTETSIQISDSKVTAVGGWGASGIGSGADDPAGEYGAHPQARAEISIADSQLYAYADGTKFAVDSKSGGGTSTASAPGGPIIGVLQGTFVNNGSLEGQAVQVVSADAAEYHSLQLPAGYRSFAVNVGGADGYQVKNSAGDTAYALSSDEYAAGENGAQAAVLYAAGTFSDAFYLYAPAPTAALKTVKTAGRGMLLGAADGERGDGSEATSKTLAVQIIWEDDNDAATKRPESVTVTLLINGEAAEDPVPLVLNADENWAGEFADLPLADDNGEDITYTVSQNSVDSYETAAPELSADGGTYTITNTYSPEPSPETSPEPSTEPSPEPSASPSPSPTTAPKPATIRYATDDLPVKKLLVGRTPPKDETFRFTLKAVSTNVSGLKGKLPMPSGSQNQQKTVKLKGPGETEFGLITFTKPGTYIYQVQEVNDKKSGYTYDSSVYTVTYEIRQEGNDLFGVRDITKGGRSVASCIFVNGYSTRPRTGDNRNAALWGAVAGLALCGVMVPAVILLRKRKRK